MCHPTFARLGHQGKKRKTGRDLFPERIEGPIPWRPFQDRILSPLLQSEPGTPDLRVGGDSTPIAA